ncbi:MAG: SpoIID/LytB domain-containing protein [Patescibacteria group bacterium]
MYKNSKIYPMLGSSFSLNNWKRKQESATFKGTLVGIVVSFLILIFCAFLLNLAENYWYVGHPGAESRTSQDKRDNAISEGEGYNDGFISFDWNKILGIKTVRAATINNYKAQTFIKSAEKLELAPGEEVLFKIGFKNIGKAAWSNSGLNFVSIYTYNPKYRTSEFQGTGWYKFNQPAKLKETKVNAGQIGYIEFYLKAPVKEGDYKESFYLAAENKAWVEGGLFSIDIKVKNKIVAATEPAKQTSALNFQGELLLKSHEKIEAKSGEIVDLRFGFKNTGKVNWEMQGLMVPQENLEDDGKSIFFYPTWTSGHEPTVSGVIVKTGEIGFLNLKIKTPETAGTYNAKFKLVANYDKEVVGAEVDIPVYVTDETAGADQSGRVSQNINMTEPTLEIGLSYFESAAPEAVELTSEQAYQLADKEGNFLASFSGNESVRINYNFYSKVFFIQNARINLQAEGELHFKGVNENTVFTILSLSRPYSGGWNDNKYRDEIILRYVPTTGRLWTINRLPMEHYLWGIAETSNISPLDYIKSIIVASRSYALYHYLNPYKYNGYFTLRATTADQLYRGYNSEIRSSRVVQAVNETKGQAVTYQKDVVVTPYFGHSDGKTRSWASVFGGANKPWLIPVATPYDSGMEMFGHGVGMSANDAYGHAKTDGWDYTKILKYYYNGIEVSRLY